MWRLLSLLLVLFQKRSPGILAQSACGRPMVEGRIVGGGDAGKGAWPWQVELRMNGMSICGGSLITKSVVLTAAHCFAMPLNISIYSVYLGVHRLTSLEDSSIVAREVQNVIINPNYTVDGSGGDIALIVLDEPVVFTPYILPICLPSPTLQLPEGTQCWATGWGNIQEKAPLPSPTTLQEVQVAVISNQNCEAMYRSVFRYRPSMNLIHADMMCAGYKGGQKDACKGDSGGPLVHNVNGTWVQVGIISWGFGCAKPNQPGVYTNVQYYMSWLMTNVPSLMYDRIGNTLTSSSELRNETLYKGYASMGALPSGAPSHIYALYMVTIFIPLWFMFFS